MAAYMAGCRQVLIPADNMKDLEEIDPIVRQSLIFTPCEVADDVLNHALLPIVPAAEEENDTLDLSLLASAPAIGTTSPATGISGRAE